MAPGPRPRKSWNWAYGSAGQRAWRFHVGGENNDPVISLAFYADELRPRRARVRHARVRSGERSAAGAADARRRAGGPADRADRALSRYASRSGPDRLHISARSGEGG